MIEAQANGIQHFGYNSLSLRAVIAVYHGPFGDALLDGFPRVQSRTGILKYDLHMPSE